MQDRGYFLSFFLISVFKFFKASEMSVECRLNKYSVWCRQCDELYLNYWYQTVK